MAVASELQSLEEISYKSPNKLKAFAVVLLAIFLLIIGFLNFYPIGEEIRNRIRAATKGSACRPDFRDLKINPFLLQISVVDATIPASCMDREGEPIRLDFVDVNYRLINFFPFGLPFKVDTVIGGQPLSLHYVLGIGQQMVRVKDQQISLAKIMPLLSPSTNMGGTVTINLSLRTNMKGGVTALEFQAGSKDFELPSQSIEGFTLPSLKVGSFFASAIMDTPPTIKVERLDMGQDNETAPIRIISKGRIALQNGNASMSALDLRMDVKFSDQLLQTIPLIDPLLARFPKKDGFYAIRLGGTLGQPQPMPASL